MTEYIISGEKLTTLKFCEDILTRHEIVKEVRSHPYHSEPKGQRCIHCEVRNDVQFCHYHDVPIQSEQLTENQKLTQKIRPLVHDARIRISERNEVLDDLISHYKKVIEDGKGVTYNHPIDYQWMYGGVVKYLEELRQKDGSCMRGLEKCSKDCDDCPDTYTCSESSK